jgi:hypothetical protein
MRNLNDNIDLFVLIAVSHALNNEGTVPLDVPVLPLASASADVISRSKGKFSFVLEDRINLFSVTNIDSVYKSELEPVRPDRMEKIRPVPTLLQVIPCHKLGDLNIPGINTVIVTRLVGLAIAAAVNIHHRGVAGSSPMAKVILSKIRCPSQRDNEKGTTLSLMLLIGYIKLIFLFRSINGTK